MESHSQTLHRKQETLEPSAKFPLSEIRKPHGKRTESTQEPEGLEDRPQQGSDNQPEQSSCELAREEQCAQCLRGSAPDSLMWIPV